MKLDFIPPSTRAAGLSALMKGAGWVTRYLPIPQPTLLVGPGASSRLGQSVAGFGHRKILIVTEKLLTGFDAPVLYAMYLDKPLRDHTLLQ
ncbi:MAG: hypothetical protein EBU07_16395, partial [Betaproteobacteria bacterium]|nr:hypothetical protein [Betaproteobacteria bacterium]